MQDSFFDNPIEYVKGVGPQRAEVLKKELSVFTAGDLIFHFPFRYIDRSKFYKINEISDELPYVQIKGIITSVSTVGVKRASRIVAHFKDDTGSMELIWFQGISWLKQLLKAGYEYVVFGKPSIYGRKLNIVHPEIELFSTFEVQPHGKLQAIYSTTENCKAKGLDSRGILKIQKNLFQNFPIHIEETLPGQLIDNLKLLSLRESLINIHLPQADDILAKAQFRLKFEELFYMQLKLLSQKQHRKETIAGKKFTYIGEYFNTFYKLKLPFELTEAQKRVIKEIRADCGSGKQMNRLLQGDVGSGKTVVALLCMLMALDNNCQAALMAPTEILAGQHFKSISRMLNGMPVTVHLLTGSTPLKERKMILKNLEEGSLQIIIGTHALIEDKVIFNNPGIMIIDEQHRFGVEQRARFWMKEKEQPHVLVMTATPIPRTLAMTLYGDLDNSVIDEIPPGRKAVKTYHLYESSRLKLFAFMRDEIKKGRQVYIVYPLIEESEKLDLANLMQGYDAIVREFPLPDFRVSIVHGKMKLQDREYEMQQFVKGITQIMVATTVIEVGVDVPNASLMVIENAERFGLSQLHQLRGRVGRGADQSHCFLMTSNKISGEARLRLSTMVRTNNGFEIAEMDLKLRGPGELAGTQQSGILDLKIADPGKDQRILELARHSAQTILNDDAHFQKPENTIIKKILSLKNKSTRNWIRVS